MSPTGQLVGNRYQLDGRIAVGGMGEVWRASDTVLHRVVAVKLLKPEFAGDAAFRERFLAEARHAAVLDHPGIARVYDFGDTADADDAATRRPFIVMELVNGEALSDRIGSGRRLPPAEAARIVALAADALQAAHQRGIVHRDVKPGNLMLTDTGGVKITDFGIAKALGSVPVTATGMVIGTPHYLSPEQAAGRGVTAASDVYSLGVVLYEALSGARPFDKDSPVATAVAHVRDAPPPLGDDIPAGLRAITAQALAKEPEQRQRDAAELAAQLRFGPDAASPAGSVAAVGVVADPETRVLAPETVATSTPTATAATAATATDAPARPWYRRPLALAAAMLLVLALIGGAAAALLNDDPPTASADDPATTSTPRNPPEAEQTTETTPPTTTPPPEEPPGVLVDPTTLVGREWTDVSSELEGLGLIPRRADLTEAQVTADPALAAAAASAAAAGITEAVLSVSPTGEVAEGASVTVGVYLVPADDGEGEGEGNEGEGNEGEGNEGQGNEGQGNEGEGNEGEGSEGEGAEDNEGGSNGNGNGDGNRADASTRGAPR